MNEAKILYFLKAENPEMSLSIIEKEKIDFSVRDENGQSILHICLMKNYTHIFTAVLAILDATTAHRSIHDPIPRHTYSTYQILTITCNQGIGLHHIAAYRNQLDVLIVLNSYKIPMFTKNNLKLDVFYYAAQNDSIKTFLWLLLMNNHQLSVDGENTPLHYAVFYGSYQVCKLICERRLVDVNIRDSHGYTPVYIAVLRRQIDCFKVLMYHGSNISDDLYQGWNIYSHIQFRHKELAPYVKSNNCSQQLAMKFSLHNTNSRLLSRFFGFLIGFISLKLYTVDLMNLMMHENNINNFNTVQLIIVIQIAISFIFIINLYLVCFYAQRHPKRTDEELLELYKEHEPHLVCSKCVTNVYPKISRHCIYCDSCTLIYEHHCPWINICIGYNNYRSFTSFLSFLLISMYLIIGVKIYIVIKQINHWINYVTTWTEIWESQFLTNYDIQYEVVWTVYTVGEVMMLIFLSMSIMYIMVDTYTRVQKLALTLETRGGSESITSSHLKERLIWLSTNTADAK